MGIGEKVQLFKDRAKTIPISYETKAEYVTLSDGNNLEEVLNNDLTTPTVTHEETSFKVGVGDIDVSSSVVDGEPSKVVIKGKTYQNILPEPSLRNSMTNGKSMQKLNEGYENVNVVDGVAKSAILYGSTLVNINSDMNQINEKTNITPFDVLEERIIKCVTNGKKYLISGEVSKCTLRLFFDGVEQPAETRLTENRKYVIFSFIGNELNIRAQKDAEQGNCYYNNIKIIEYQDGMENWDIPYFAGMQSVRMPVLSSVGKNLFDENNGYLYNYYNVGDTLHMGTSVNDNRYRTTTPIKINPNTTYVYSSPYINRNRATYRDIKMNYITTVNIINNSFTTPNNAYYVELYICNDDTLGDNNNLNVQLEEGSTATTYEPYKSNILSTPNDLELRGIGDVKDTLNLLTGEIVSNFEPFVFNGSENWILNDDTLENTTRFILKNYVPNMVANQNVGICNNFAWGNIDKDFPGIIITIPSGHVYLRTPKMSVDELKTMLSNNPIHGYYIKEKSIKTVDLSSYGNWEKVILDGDDNIALSLWDSNSNGKAPDVQGVYTTNSFTDAIPQAKVIASGIKADFLGISDYNNETCFMSGTQKINFNIFKDKLSSPTVEGVKEYLKSNPITVWYQTTTSQENSITEMLSFSNGHIQLSSEEGSLIPSLDYEVSTSNSYHMDLLKNNVIYTMKCENPNGKLLVKDADITLRENRTIQIGLQYMPDDNLFINTGSWTNPMIIEGDLTSKTLPYFKGIKSSFENEDKIEVLSTGKNLLDKDNIVVGGSNFWESNKYDIKRDALNRMTLETLIDVNTQRVVVSLDSNYYVAIQQYDENECRAITSDSGWRQNEWSVLLDTKTKKINIIVKNMTDSNITNDDIKTIKNSLQIEYGSNKTTYDSYKSNVSKIPLLSPLRSLPNGVCDELIIDRMKKKAKIIQRVGKAMFDGSDSEIWGFMDSPSDTTSYLYQCYVRDAKANSNDTSEHLLCKNILVRTANSNWNNKYESGIALNENKNIQLRCTKDESSFRSWLSKNPTTVYYQLETPVVTEIDLESFPLVYKDGHIFLNSEIAPVVEIAYSINQSQQIQSNNETLQRHELDILDLDNLIVSFVNAEYNLRLLKFDMELSMMALAE